MHGKDRGIDTRRPLPPARADSTDGAGPARMAAIGVQVAARHRGYTLGRVAGRVHAPGCPQYKAVIGLPSKTVGSESRDLHVYIARPCAMYQQKSPHLRLMNPTEVKQNN